MTSVLPEGSLSIKERRQLLLQKGLPLVGAAESNSNNSSTTKSMTIEESKPSSSAISSNKTTTSPRNNVTSTTITTSPRNDNVATSNNSVVGGQFASIKDKIKLLEKTGAVSGPPPSNNNVLTTTTSSSTVSNNNNATKKVSPREVPSVPTIEKPPPSKSPVYFNAIPPPPPGLSSFDAIKELHRDEYQEFEYQLKQAELEFEKEPSSPPKQDEIESSSPRVPMKNYEPSSIATSTLKNVDNRKELEEGKNRTITSNNNPSANNNTGVPTTINNINTIHQRPSSEGVNFPTKPTTLPPPTVPTSRTHFNNSTNINTATVPSTTNNNSNNTMLINNNMQHSRTTSAPPTSSAKVEKKLPIVPPPTSLLINNNMVSNTVSSNTISTTASSIYNYPISASTNVPPMDDVHYPSAPSIDDIDHHFPEYQANNFVNNNQFQTMTNNIFKPITDSLSDVSEEDDYRMFTQFKEFIMSQQPNSGMSEEKLYGLYISFRERYQQQGIQKNMSQSNLNANKQSQQPPNVVFVNRSRVPTSSTKAKPIVNPNSPTVSTTSSNSSGSEKKRDGLRDVRKKYEEQKLEEWRIKQMKERNKAHFTQEMQQPCMDYNGLVMRENSMYSQPNSNSNNNGGNSQYPTVHNPNDLISNGTYVPFNAAHPQSSSQLTNAATQRALNGNINPNSSGYMGYNYWSNNK